MLSIFSYSKTEGLLESNSISELRQLVAEKDRITWVDMENPTAEETELLDSCFNFHPLTIDDCIEPQSHPKVDNYGDYLFIIAHAVLPKVTLENFETGELDLFLGKNFLVTYHQHRLRSIEEIKVRLHKNSRSIFKSADFLMATLLDILVDYYNPMLENVEEKIESLEDKILEGVEPTLLRDIFDLKRSLGRLRLLSVQQTEMLNHLIKDGYDEILPFSLPYLSDVKDHLIRATNLTEAARDGLATLIEAHLLVSSNKAADVMKVLAIMAAIMLPMTFIASIYGMNFRFMPELDWKYGYHLSLALMLSIGGGLFFYFRRKKWL
jgi:magnesium transporter